MDDVRTWSCAVRERFRQIFRRMAGKTRLPPVSLRDVGPGDFEEIGRDFLRYSIELASLRPPDSVLEIGCGIGRMALPLAAYLHDDGSYTGVDVVARAITWCRRNISRRHSNFTFHHIDVFNRRYNPKGKIQPREYVFPFADRFFDLVLVVSVFSHMLPADVDHYLCETQRLLRPAGRLFSTFFLLNPVQQSLARQGRNQIDFAFDRGIYRIRDESIPESAVALEESAVRSMFGRVGLILSEPIRYGTWSGRQDGLSFPDIIIAESSPAK